MSGRGLEGKELIDAIYKNPEAFKSKKSGCFSVFLILPLILILSIYCL
jgi:hypothetical protein